MTLGIKREINNLFYMKNKTETHIPHSLVTSSNSVYLGKGGQVWASQLNLTRI